MFETTDIPETLPTTDGILNDGEPDILRQRQVFSTDDIAEWFEGAKMVYGTTLDEIKKEQTTQLEQGNFLGAIPRLLATASVETRHNTPESNTAPEGIAAKSREVILPPLLNKLFSPSFIGETAVTYLPPLEAGMTMDEFRIATLEANIYEFRADAAGPTEQSQVSSWALTHALATGERGELGEALLESLEMSLESSKEAESDISIEHDAEHSQLLLKVKLSDLMGGVDSPAMQVLNQQLKTSDTPLHISIPLHDIESRHISSHRLDSKQLLQLALDAVDTNAGVVIAHHGYSANGEVWHDTMPGILSPQLSPAREVILASQIHQEDKLLSLSPRVIGIAPSLNGSEQTLPQDSSLADISIEQEGYNKAAIDFVLGALAPDQQVAILAHSEAGYGAILASLYSFTRDRNPLYLIAPVTSPSRWQQKLFQLLNPITAIHRLNVRLPARLEARGNQRAAKIARATLGWAGDLAVRRGVLRYLIPPKLQRQIRRVHAKEFRDNPGYVEGGSQRLKTVDDINPYISLINRLFPECLKNIYIAMDDRILRGSGMRKVFPRAIQRVFKKGGHYLQGHTYVQRQIRIDLAQVFPSLR